jgi:hypothetical protein
MLVLCEYIPLEKKLALWQIVFDCGLMDFMETEVPGIRLPGANGENL